MKTFYPAKKSRPLVVFFHGMMGGPEDFFALVKSINFEFPVLLYNLLEVPCPSWNHFLNFLHQDLQSYSRTVILVGYSMGARIALSLSQNFTPNYPHLFIISGHPGLPDEDHEGRHKRLMQDSQLFPKSTQLMPEFLHRWYTSPPFSIPKRRSPLLHRLIEKKRRIPIQKWHHFLQQTSLGHQADTSAHLLKSSGVYLISGERDLKYNSLYRELKKKNPSLHHFSLPNSGHHVLCEQSKKVARRLKQFLHNFL